MTLLMDYLRSSVKVIGWGLRRPHSYRCYKIPCRLQRDISTNFSQYSWGTWELRFGKCPHTGQSSKTSFAEQRIRVPKNRQHFSPAFSEYSRLWSKRVSCWHTNYPSRTSAIWLVPFCPCAANSNHIMVDEVQNLRLGRGTVLNRIITEGRKFSIVLC